MIETRVGRASWYALILVALANAMSLLDRNILAILAPRIKADLHIGDAEMGLLYGTVFALFYALFSLPLGRLADGWVRTRLLGLAIGFWSIATGIAAFAHGFALLALSRLGVGIGEGAVYPAGYSLIFDHFPKAKRGIAMAVVAAAIAIGLGCSLVLGGVAADWWDHRLMGRGAPLGLRGWQFAFLVAALPGFLVAALLLRMPEPKRGQLDGIRSPRDPHPFRACFGVLGSVTPVCNWLALGKRRASARDWLWNGVVLCLLIVAMVWLTRLTSAFSPRPALKFGALSISPHALQWSVVGFGLFVVFNFLQSLKYADRPAFMVITRSPALLLCITIGSLQTMINYGIMGFTPSFLMKHYGLSPTVTGLQFGAVATVMGVIGPLIAGPVSDRVQVRFPGVGRVYVALIAMGLSPLIAIWVYGAENPASFYARFVLYSVVLTGWLPPLYAVMFEQVLPRMRGITSSTYVIASTILGLGVGPFVVGMIADANGGNLAAAILSVNWVAPLIVLMLCALARRVVRDETSMIQRARSAGEPI